MRELTDKGVSITLYHTQTQEVLAVADRITGHAGRTFLWEQLHTRKHEQNCWP